MILNKMMRYKLKYKGIAVSFHFGRDFLGMTGKRFQPRRVQMLHRTSITSRMLSFIKDLI